MFDGVNIDTLVACLAVFFVVLGFQLFTMKLRPALRPETRSEEGTGTSSAAARGNLSSTESMHKRQTLEEGAMRIAAIYGTLVEFIVPIEILNVYTVKSTSLHS